MDNITNTYPKYQYSKFIGQDQIVVRSENADEFKKLVEFVKGFGMTKVADPTDSWQKPVTVDQGVEGHVCATHNVQMKEGISKTKFEENGSPKKYWSHSKKEGDKWLRCFGKGYLTK